MSAAAAANTTGANTPKKIIAVLGATGQQGGSVVAALHRDGAYAVRAITRDAKSDKATELAKKYPGVEVVSGDLKDAKSLTTAFAGVHGVFIVTLPQWGSADMSAEIAQGTTAADAAFAAKVKHVVLSTLPSGQKVGGVLVTHFDAKWRIAEYLIANAHKHAVAYTNVLIPYFMENFQSPYFGAKADASGKLAFAVPMGGKPMAVSSVGAYGSVIAPIFADPKKFDGKLVNYDGDIASLQTYVDTFKRVTGRDAVANDLPLEVFAKFPNQSHELVAMFQLYHAIADIRAKGQNPYTTPLGIADADFIAAQSFVKEPLTFEAWLKRTGWYAPASAAGAGAAPAVSSAAAK